MITILGRRIDERPIEENDQNEASCTDVYVLQTAHKNVSRFVIMSWPDLPQLHDLYSSTEDFESSLRLRRRRLRPVDDSSGLIWELECEYSTKTSEKNQEEEDEPLDKRPEVSIDFETYQTAAEGALIVGETTSDDEDAAVDTIGFFGRPLVNSAGEPFDPQPEMDQVRPVMTVTFNEINLNMPLLMHYANCVNSTSWLGCQPRTWKMGGARINKQVEKGQRYWQIALTFTFNKQTWDLQLLNQGTYYLDGGTTEMPFLDSEGNRIVGLLDSDGDQLNDALTDDPTYSRYRVYKERDFNLLFDASILDL